jgi:hypothetical protein
MEVLSPAPQGTATAKQTKKSRIFGSFLQQLGPEYFARNPGCARKITLK